MLASGHFSRSNVAGGFQRTRRAYAEVIRALELSKLEPTPQSQRRRELRDGWPH
jgi:hypothetical protein